MKFTTRLQLIKILIFFFVLIISLLFTNAIYNAVRMINIGLEAHKMNNNNKLELWK